MKIGAQVPATSSISTSNAETILVRGHDLAGELIGRISFTEHAWLLIAGTLPTDAQRRILDATLVAIAEHGLVPSVVAARMTYAAAPEAMQGAVAAGLLGSGSVILGASEAAGRVFDQVVKRSQGGTQMDQAAREVVGELRRDKRPVPGYGHPLHKTRDARAARLLALADELGVTGQYVAAAIAVEQATEAIVGRSLPMNVSGAIPSVLLDAGYPLLALKGVPLLARTAGLIAHLLEEQTTPIGFMLANEGSSAVTYTGPAPEGFVADQD